MMEWQPDFPIKISEQQPIRISTEQSGNTNQQNNIPSPTVIDPIHQELKELFQAASALPKDSPRRRKLLNRLIEKMQQCGKLWTQKENPHHEDAESETWLYLVRKVNGDTDTDYDPEKGSLITLWNRTYKLKLDELTQARKNKQTQWEARQRVHPQRDSKTGQWQDPIDGIAEPAPVPSRLEQVQEWVEADATGKLSQTCIRKNRPDVTAQTVVLRMIQRAQQGEKWTLKQLAEEFGVPEGTMNSFWSQKCKPLLRELGQVARD